MSSASANCSDGRSRSAWHTVAACSRATKIAGMPSAAGAASTAPSGTDPRSASRICVLSIHDQGLGGPVIRHARRLARQLAEALLIDLALQLHDAVDERLGARRTAGHEHVHGDDLIDALHQRVVV